MRIWVFDAPMTEGLGRKRGHWGHWGWELVQERPKKVSVTSWKDDGDLPVSFIALRAARM